MTRLSEKATQFFAVAKCEFFFLANLRALLAHREPYIISNIRETTSELYMEISLAFWRSFICTYFNAEKGCACVEPVWIFCSDLLLYGYNTLTKSVPPLLLPLTWRRFTLSPSVVALSCRAPLVKLFSSHFTSKKHSVDYFRLACHLLLLCLVRIKRKGVRTFWLLFFSCAFHGLFLS